LSDVISLPPEQIEAAIARIKAEKERRLVEKVEAGEIVSVPLFVVAGSETEARTKVEQAKADKLAELRAAGDQREVVWDVTMIVTGVRKHGEAAGPAWVPTAPPFLPRPERDEVVEEEVVREEPGKKLPENGKKVPQPPVIETYVQVQVRQCHDDDDPGEIAEGWFSIDGKTLKLTDKNGRFVGSHVMLEGENARVVAKQLLRENAPASESFNRRLSYPSAGLA
jgi:hypothetical protein